MRKTIVALMVLAALAAFSTASTAGYGKGGSKGGSASSAGGNLIVPDGAYGDTVTASANPGGAGVYVLAKCFSNDSLVWGGYFAVDSDLHAQIGPISASNWANSSASCTAEEGYFTRDGFGRWVVLAATTFNVTAR